MEVNIEATVETITQTPAGQVPEGLVNEVTKQQVLVQYLKVCIITFLRQIALLYSGMF